MISDFLGSFLTPPPPISDFSPILKAFLHRDSPIFENLPPSLKSDIIYGWPLFGLKMWEIFLRHVHKHKTCKNGHNHFVFSLSQVFWQCVGHGSNSTCHCNGIFGIANGVLKWKNILFFLYFFCTAHSQVSSDQ